MVFMNKKSMYSAAVMLGLSTVSFCGAASAAVWTLTPQSQISFKIKSLGLSQVKGDFHHFQSKLRFDPEAPNKGRVELQLEASSVTFSSPELKNLILGSDYFFVEKYKKVKFISTSIQAQAYQHYSVKGNLTIRGVTQPVVFDTKLIPNAENPKLMDVHSKAVINRTAFGMKKSLGGVGEKVHIELKGQWNKQ